MMYLPFGGSTHIQVVFLCCIIRVSQCTASKKIVSGNRDRVHVAPQACMGTGRVRVGGFTPSPFIFHACTSPLVLRLLPLATSS